MAASTAPAAKTLHLSLFSYLIKRKVWLAGIGMVLVASVCQAIALATGPVALVQPIFIIELPFTLLVASRLAHRKLPRQTWWAVGLVTVALGDALISACYGVTVLGEQVNTGGGLLVIEIVAVIAIAIGCIELSRSLAMVHQAQPQPVQPQPAELPGEPGADRVPGSGRPAGR